MTAVAVGPARVTVNTPVSPPSVAVASDAAIEMSGVSSSARFTVADGAAPTA